MIRQARAGDAPELAALCTELGYPAAEDDILRRFAWLHGILFVAVGDDDRAIGWVNAVVRRPLELDPYMQIAGLIVSGSHRSRGIGAALVARAEEWGREQGVSRVIVRSNVLRERAHEFYLRAGYSLAKTSRVFMKGL